MKQKRQSLSGTPFALIGQMGFTLVELMVALVLGLVVIGGVISVFLSNQQSYRTNQALGEIQDNSRTAFEFLARDIRSAGLTGCGNLGRVANVLNNSGTDWWANWGNAVRGYDSTQVDPAVAIGTAPGDRVAGTDSIQLMGAGNSDLSVVTHNENAANFKVSAQGSEIPDGAIVIVCDPTQATILQVNKGNSTNVTVEYNTGNAVNPGNCSKGLGYPTTCTTNGNAYTYGANSMIATLSTVDWYIGVNPVGGSSLYRLVPDTTGATKGKADEMVRNVTGMQLQYLVNGNGAGGTQFVDAQNVANWDNVTAVRVALTMQSTNQRAGTDVQPLTRPYVTTVTLRNRVD